MNEASIDPSVARQHVIDEGNRIAAEMIGRLKAAGLSGDAIILAMSAAAQINRGVCDVAALLGGREKARRAELVRVLYTLCREFFETGEVVADAVGRGPIVAALAEMKKRNGGPQ